ncbi:MAG: GNAT family N-acetyltransferase [Myxococcales bacterium]|nr:GNAT family N-acetyltransferase [Myxococcales bacterium]
MRIDVAFDAVAALADGPEAIAIAEVVETATAVVEALRRRGHDARLLPLDDVTMRVRASSADVIFNLAESLRGQTSLEPAVAWVYELEGRAFTGATASTLERCLHKGVTRALLRDADVAIPEGRVIRHADAPLDDLPFPLFLKPVQEDASHGIDLGSVVHDEASARARIASLLERFGHGVLAEAWIDGRELNVSIVQDGDALRVLPAAEIDFSDFPEGAPKVLTYDAKWNEESPEYTGSRAIAAELDDNLRSRVEETALAAFRALGLRGYGRVDLRVDARRIPFVIDVNPNPALARDAGFALAAGRAGLDWDTLVERIALEAATRMPKRKTLGPDRVSLVPLRIDHREELLAHVRATGAFRDDELEVARELIDEGLKALDEEREHPDYEFVVAEHDGRAVGYACFGLASLSDGFFDLYWIVVDPHTQGRGIGRSLLRAAEKRAAARGGRWLVAETSGMPSYEATRAFYRASGYVELGRLPEFYRAGDDKIFFGRALR